MDLKEISIATITWARNSEEEKLLRESLQELARLNIPAFICDGGSGSEFLEFIEGFSKFTLVPRNAPGVWWQVKSSLEAAYASGTAFIFYTEPDRLDFFREEVLQFLQRARPEGVWLACRSEEAFESFPAFQRSTETAINLCCAEIVGKNLDFTYGPFLLPRELVPYLHLVQEDIGWGWRPFVFGIAKRLGYELREHCGDFHCPVEQRFDDRAERIYRMRQLRQNIDGILLSNSVSF